jgi:hypothetical protein
MPKTVPKIETTRKAMSEFRGSEAVQRGRSEGRSQGIALADTDSWSWQIIWTGMVQPISNTRALERRRPWCNLPLRLSPGQTLRFAATNRCRNSIQTHPRRRGALPKSPQCCWNSTGSQPRCASTPGASPSARKRSLPRMPTGYRQTPRRSCWRHRVSDKQ